MSKGKLYLIDADEQVVNRPLLDFQLSLLQKEKFSEVILVVDDFATTGKSSCKLVEAFVKEHNAKVSALLRVSISFSMRAACPKIPAFLFGYRKEISE